MLTHLLVATAILMVLTRQRITQPELATACSQLVLKGQNKMSEQTTIAELLAGYPANKLLKTVWASLPTETPVAAHNVRAIVHYSAFTPESRVPIWEKLLGKCLATTGPADTTASPASTPNPPDLATIRTAAEITDTQLCQLARLRNMRWRIDYRNATPDKDIYTVMSTRDGEQWLKKNGLSRLGLEDLNILGAIVLTRTNLGLGNEDRADAIACHADPSGRDPRKFLLPAEMMASIGPPLGDCQLTQRGELIGELVEPQTIPGAVEHALEFWRRFGIDAKELTDDEHQKLLAPSAQA